MKGGRLKTCVLISGSGTNLQALIDACAAPDFPAEIVLVISNRADAGGLDRARRAGIPTRIIPHKDYASREAFDAAIDAALRAAGVEFVCLAGFMRLLTAGFVNQWRDRLINIHPSLLPAFKGIDAVEQALAAGVSKTGCTVHFVRPEMDAGPILLQAEVPVEVADTSETLHDRIRQAEHRCYPEALRLISAGKVRVDGESVIFAE
ncbi:MAG TPA: phosphoribosylglycinamide formyltransferase [Alphaproteobacteria bacterium]|nr:phosphoribosylglycinamide formyltransferase [Alphaproteobacteria bacterium]